MSFENLRLKTSEETQIDLKSSEMKKKIIKRKNKFLSEKTFV